MSPAQAALLSLGALASVFNLRAAEVKTKGDAAAPLIPSLEVRVKTPAIANVPVLIPRLPAPLDAGDPRVRPPEFKAPPALPPALPPPVVRELSRSQADTKVGPAVSERGEKDPEALTARGREQFDEGGPARSFWGGLKEMIFGAPQTAGPGVPPPAHPVRSVEYAGGKYLVNSRAAERLGFGSFKDVLLHPEDPGLDVKVFYREFRHQSSLDEKRLEVRNIRLLEKAGATPRLVEQGGVAMRGRDIGYVVQERVRGATLETATPAKLREVRRLFDKLAAAGLEIADADRPFKLRQNIMVGETDSGGFAAYLVDADLVLPAKTRGELKAFYDRVYASLVSRQ